MAIVRFLRPAASSAVRILTTPHRQLKLRNDLIRTCVATRTEQSDTSPGQAQNSTPSLCATSKTPSPSRAKEIHVRLDIEASSLIDAHREALRTVLASIRSIPEASKADIRLVEAEIARLGDGFFMLVVAGEYNAGKSSLINALVGRNVLAEGPTPTTSAITKLKYASQSLEPVVDEDGVLVVGEPVDVLANRLQIVDTPGTNAIKREHETLTRDFLPLCDIVLFVTSADRPFSESERSFLESIRKWGKKVVMVVNKVDLLEGYAREEVVEFVSVAAGSLLGNDPKVFLLSSKYAKMAIGASGAGEYGALWEESGFAQLRDYINESLDSMQRLRLKLRASASLGRTLSDKYNAVMESNKTIVDSDLSVIRKVETLLGRHEDAVRKGYPAHFARADNVLLETLNRADVFFDSHLRVSNSWNLSNRAAVEQAFEEEVVRGTAKAIQRQIQSLGEWLSDATSRNLTETTALFSRRVGERAREISAMHKEQGISSDTSTLSFSCFPSGKDIEVTGGRERFVTRLSEVSDDLSIGFVSGKEGKKIADKIAGSVRLGVGLGVGGMGSMSLFLLNSSSVDLATLFADPTMPLLAGAMGALGLVTVPRQRMALRSELRTKVATTRMRLRSELNVRLEEQLNAHISCIREAILPFSDFSEKKGEEISDRMSNIAVSLKAVEQLETRLRALESSDEQHLRNG
eukprot:GFKZ01000283.1.p1 GENE.GFKZ01000283.1~~GFKZ01000283.1.p1  ORF type:complete len:692 (-),score=110.69 GFKZ01000283.1:875-2950(-)